MGKAGRFWFSFAYVEGQGGVDNAFTLNMLSSSAWGRLRPGCPVVTILEGRLGLMMCSDFYYTGFHIFWLSVQGFSNILLIYPFQELENQTNRKLYTFSYI